MRLIAAACLGLLLLPTPSVADCADDLQQLRPRIDRIKTSDRQRYNIANKWLGEAEEAEPDDEVQCHNFYIKAYRALTQPMNKANDAGGAAARGGEGAGTSIGPRPPANAPVAPAPLPFVPPQPLFGPSTQPGK
jgi:hypothetical protein